MSKAGSDHSLIADAIEDAIKDVSRHSLVPTSAGDTLQIKKDAWITAVIDLQRTADRCRKLAEAYKSPVSEPAQPVPTGGGQDATDDRFNIQTKREKS